MERKLKKRGRESRRKAKTKFKIEGMEKIEFKM